uniref:F5/8 type C domain-containing protein n=1 Tax=viral metagenome TaxID=1070528 RepID=A0A6C0CMM5_9ZZZZ
MSLEQTIGNLEIRYANVVTFVGSSNTMVDTTTGRIQTKGIQHNSNVITDVSGPHGRVAPTLKKYPEIAFESGKFDSNDSTNTYVQAGYTVTVSTTYSTHRAFKAFNGVPNDFFHWQSGSFSNSDGTYSGGTQLFESIPGEWLKIEVPNKIKPASINLYRRDFDGQSPKDFKIYASITGSSWTLLTEQTGIDNWTNAAKSYNFDTGIYYKYFAILVTKITRTNSAGAQTSGTLGELEIYGYEEDPPTGDHSVDTTFKSRFNNPQLTGVQVLVDGATGVGTNHISGGPDPSGNQATMTSPNKYWTLNGTLTSNLSVEANTFLEGDQPHAVSVWFNSSNLEANVSNTCVFSISDQEKLNSQNLDLQSNTWHNLTYAYQGEGGSKVTYLDGRKVAEDQAEDTFGDYPPFAMTAYSQGGYVVSASSSYAEGSYPAWEAFNNIWHNNGNTNGSDTWLSENATNYNGVDGLYSKSPPRNLGTGAHDGEWIKIEMPHKFKLDYITIYPRYQHDNKAPRDFIVYGSNDNVNWSPVLTKTGASITSSHVETGHTFSMDVYDTCYKYFGLVTRKLRSNTSFVAIAEIKFYGHRENDLVRLPDPTNVLKYPHIVMTGQSGSDDTAQRGYVVTSSGKYPTGSEDQQPWKVFDGDTSTFWKVKQEYTVGTTGGTHSGNNLPDPGPLIVTVPSGSVTKTGEFVILETPHKLKITKVDVVATYAGRRPTKVAILGSNTKTQTGWRLLNDDTLTLPAQDTNTVTIPSPTYYYKYHAYVILQATSGHAGAQTYELRYYGTEEGSVPLQIGGGNIDKVANFRVYDKFIGEDQVNEIWNAQKEEFGRAKPQMVLQQGKLGIGTDAPQGSLSVADEPDPTTYGLQEFPPKPLAGYKTHIEGHGVFCASASSDYTTTGNGSAFSAFDKNEEEWTGDVTFSSGALTGAGLTTITNGIGAGPWVQLELPYKILLEKWAIQARTSQQSRHLKSAILVGSNDGNTWDTIQTVTNQPSQTTLQYRYYNVSGNNKYHKYLRLVVTEVNNGDRPEVNEIKFFGYREQLPPKQSVLHDGQLTLTKNLTVPSIGPSVTNTRHVVPKRHKLVLEFDTSTNPTDLTTVNDTSEMGNDGTLRGNAYYSIGDKAFVFDGSGDYVDTGVISPSMAGARPHSMSAWFKTNATNLQFVTCLGEKNGTTTDRRFSAIRVNGNALQFWQWSNDLSKSNVIHVGLWYHAVAVYLGGGTSQSTMLMYLNGEQITSWDSDTTDGGVLGLVSPSFAVGEDIGRSNYYFNGQISKPTLYDTALTAGDVKTLYDMGRGDSYHVTNFQNTLVGINLGNGQAPRSALDVRDLIYAESSSVQTFTGQHICFPDESMEKGLVVSAKKNQFVKLNGLAIGKSAITIDESLPIVSLSNVAQDKACFGVVSKMEESNTAYRTEITGGLVSESIKIAGDNRAVVNSVGEGAIWVVDTNGPLESGDYITTSNVAGYGQKQDDDVLHNFTVAKITMDCDFTASNVAVQTIKREETGTRIITEDAWNQLVEYDRYSNVEDEITTYYQIQRGGNVLDENGQLQFEDKTGATEEPYERRFLTADGSQTDEANTVHIAAFVGCTYHCG